MAPDSHSGGRNVDALGYVVSQIVTTLYIIDVDELYISIIVKNISESRSVINWHWSGIGTVVWAALWLIQQTIFIPLLNNSIKF